jgi:prepilin-type processing-associated H-X9-DG protein
VSSLYYIYTGFAIISDEQALALYEAYHQLPFAMLASNDLTLPVPIWANSTRPDSAGQNTIPVMWDRVPLVESAFAHVPCGCNVLHMDGHVEFVRYSYYNNSDYFPVTRLSAETFGSTLPLMPVHCYE